MDSNNEFLIAVALAAGAAGVVFWNRHGQEIDAKYEAFLAFPWMTVGIITLAFIVGVFVVWRGIKLYKEYSWRNNEAKETRKQYVEKIEELLSEDLYLFS
jgi:fatty acid desaturase